MKIETDLIAVILKELEKAENEIVERWVNRDRVLEILHSHQIAPQFFQKHFGFRLYHTLLAIIVGEEKAGDCPAIHVLLHFSKDKYIEIQEIFLLCSEFKNTILLYFMEHLYGKVENETFWQLVNILDINFAGVLATYVDQNCDHQIQTPPKVQKVEVQTKVVSGTPVVQKESTIDENRLKDIRYSKQERYDAQTLFEMVDTTIIDKIEQFIEDLDELLMVWYDIEEMSAKPAKERMQDGIAIIRGFYSLVDTLIIFPVIVSSFKNLATFLDELDIEFYEDIEHKHLLVEGLIGLIKDLEQWINVIFVQKMADDVHYLDASFANNVLEIEASCKRQQIVLEEDDLEFF